MGNAAKYTEYNTSAGNTEMAGGIVDVAKLEAKESEGGVASVTSSTAPALQPADASSNLQCMSSLLERAGFFLAGAAVAYAATLVLGRGKATK